MTLLLVQAQAGEKRSSDRRARDLEIRISSLAAARAQSDKTHDADLQVCSAHHYAHSHPHFPAGVMHAD